MCTTTATGVAPLLFPVPSLVVTTHSCACLRPRKPAGSGKGLDSNTQLLWLQGWEVILGAAPAMTAHILTTDMAFSKRTNSMQKGTLPGESVKTAVVNVTLIGTCSKVHRGTTTPGVKMLSGTRIPKKPNATKWVKVLRIPKNENCSACSGHMRKTAIRRTRWRQCNSCSVIEQIWPHQLLRHCQLRPPDG